MYQNIIKKITTLIEMANSSNTYESLQSELKVIQKDLLKCEREIEKYKITTNESKYIKASDKLIDENIKISLENKIEMYEQELLDCKAKIDEVSESEEEYHEAILNIERELTSLDNFLSSLELKAKTIGSRDKSSYQFYQGLIEDATNEMATLKEQLNDKQSSYEQIKKRLSSFGEQRAKLENLLKEKQEKLTETTNYLMNPNTYIDEKLKAEDEKKLEELNKAKEELNHRKEEILEDPVYIGHEAITLIKEEDVTAAILKLKDLINKLNTLPYMNVSYEELDELLEEAENKRDEFSSSMENKDYKTHDNKAIVSRLEYLQNRKREMEASIKNLEIEIHDLDVNVVKDLMNHVSLLHTTKDELTKDIEEYRTVISENTEYKTPRKKASLTTALNQKCEDLDYIEELLKKYETELEQTVLYSKDLEENNLMKLKNCLANIDKEIMEINKNIVVTTNSQDLLAIEKDKTKLKKLADEVDAIVNRKSYKKTPNEIYKEIEDLVKETEEPEVLESDEESPINLDDYRIDELSFDEEEPPKKSFEDELIKEAPPVVEDVSSYQIPEPEIKEEPVVFPPRQTYETKNKRLKVIHVEDIVPTKEEEKKEPKKEEPKEETLDSLIDEKYMVNDLEDTNYISFNDLLEGEQDED